MHNISTASPLDLDFAFLDQGDFRTKYGSGPSHSRIRFYVQGIRCSKCVRKIEDLPLTVPGLKSLRLEFGKSLAQAEIDPALTSFSKVAEAISSLGFKPIPIASDAAEVDQERLEDRGDLIRLAVAGACAGNIMTFSFATYLGSTEDFFSIFAWLSFFLYLPVVSYVAWPFYLGAWRSLRQKQISIDLPMAVASSVGFLFSTIELARGRHDIYFDSISGFLFLILVARWSQKRLQRRFLRPQELTETLQLQRVRVCTDAEWRWIPLEALKPGSSILIEEGETLPCDAELESNRAYFSLAWLSGEVNSKTFLRGAVIPAGARLSSGQVNLRVVKPFTQTTFGKILEDVRKFSMTKVQIVTLADQWAQWLLAIVFAVALIFLAAYWMVSPEESIRRALALIILACPCAMAFGTPLALASALKKAQRKGLVVRNAQVFDKAKNIRTIFFDKTGTLTDSDLTLRENVSSIPLAYQKIVLALENGSSHPVAFSLRNAFALSGDLPFVQDWHEEPGAGVSGFIFGKFYELRSGTLFEDRHPLCTFTFAAKLKPDALEVLNELRRDGYKVALISGDKKQVVDALALQLGISPEDTFAECDPSQKAAIVARTPEAMMVGDGLNDSLAMMAAKASIASSGGVEAALQSSDVFLASTSLAGVRTLLQLSKESLSLIRGNLRISLAYNICAGVLALLGFVNPFVAAVLMPLSSGLILLMTWIGSRR